jgi:hypothetical protein
MNSDICLASVAVPVPLAAVVTNIGFHDVSYHDNDGNSSVTYSGTDWPSTLGSGVLSWDTVPFATNNNSNALRWGTTYNFRFDANVAPTTGTLTLGQYKVLGSVAANGLPVPGTPPPAFEAFCSGSGLDPTHTTQCPCGNDGALGNGCAHSFSAAGANLSASGSPPADTVVLSASNMPGTAFALYMQHDAVGDQVFHDGVLCAGGTLIRLRGRSSVGGASTFPTRPTRSRSRSAAR